MQGNNELIISSQTILRGSRLEKNYFEHAESKEVLHQWAFPEKSAGKKICIEH